MSLCVNHRPKATIGRHSLSHALAGVPAPSEREPGGVRTIQPAAQKPQDFGRFSSPLRKLRGFWLSPFIEVHSFSEAKNAPHSRQEKPIDKTLCTCYNTRELTEKFPISYRGVEQLEARRAHNPEVVGSSPASATKIIPDFDKKSGIFLTFYTNLRCFQSTL